jgi:hypothetical protein
MNVCFSFQNAVDDYYLAVLFGEECTTSDGFINLLWQNVDVHLIAAESC